MEVLGINTTNGNQSTMSNPHKDWLIQEQTALGKDISNPLMADNLPKIVWHSTHHILKSKRVGWLARLWLVVKAVEYHNL